MRAIGIPRSDVEVAHEGDRVTIRRGEEVLVSLDFGFRTNGRSATGASSTYPEVRTTLRGAGASGPPRS
jgi:hypothetical protein